MSSHVSVAVPRAHSGVVRWACFCVAAVAILLTPPRSDASLATPSAWNQPVAIAADSIHVGQLKHVGWNRDKNNDFIDDEIADRFGSGDSVNVVLELNRPYPEQVIRGFLTPDSVEITYFGRLVSCVYLRHVPYGKLRNLAAHSEVAMVEWQTRFSGITNVSSRATGAVASNTYSGADQFVREINESGARGDGVNVAILDTGVLNDSAFLPPPLTASGKVGAFDATVSPPVQEDPKPSNPLEEHGTQVAAIVLGRANPATTIYKRTDPADATDVTVSGVAPLAGLVDVKVCEQVDNCDFDDSANGEVMRGIDWVADNATSFRIRVANFSISDKVDCDGTCAICEAVNQLTAFGVVAVAGHGNADCEKKGRGRGSDGGSGRSGEATRGKKSGGCETVAGDRITASPAAATNAITVAGVNDQSTVTRGDDEAFSLYLIGPRNDASPDGTELKPDIAAPAQGVVSMGLSGDYFSTGAGTSFAAAHVSGAVALLLGERHDLGPEAVKTLLLESADKSKLGGAAWDEKFGRGFLDVGAAFHE